MRVDPFEFSHGARNGNAPALVILGCERMMRRKPHRHQNECDCGDHTLFVGAIHHLEASDRPPLVYHRGAFGSLAPKRRERVPAPEFW